MECWRTTFLLSLAFALTIARVSCAADAGLSPEQQRNLTALIAKLDSDEFEEREAAERSLEVFDSSALSVIQQILKGPISPECSERLQRAMHSIRWHDGMPPESAKRWRDRLRLRAPLNPTVNTVRYSADGTGYTAEELLTILRDHFFAPEFESDQGSITQAGEALEISLTDESHERVADLLQMMRDTAVAMPASTDPENFLPSKLEAWRSTLEKRLDTDRVNFNFNLNMTNLDDIVKRLQSSSCTPLALDADVEPEQAVDFSLKLDDVSLRSAMHWAAALSNTTFILYDHAGVLVQNHANRNLEFCVYDVSDIDATWGVDTSSWIEDGLGFSWQAGNYMEARKGRLVVRLDHESQQRLREALVQVRELMKQIRAVEPDGKAPLQPLAPAAAPVQAFHFGAIDSVVKWKQSLSSKLERKVSFSFVDKPLTEALDFIRTECNVNLVIDPALYEDGSTHSPITLRVVDMKAENALGWIVRLSNLQVMLRDEALFVTKPQALDSFTDPVSSVELRMYYVRDLTGVLPGEDLATLIKTAVRPSAWDAALSTSIAEKNGVLQIVQTPGVHAIVQTVLNEMRLHAGEKEFNATAAADAADPSVAESRRKLKEKVSVDFKEKPITEAFATLLKDLRFELDTDVNQINISVTAADMELGQVLTKLELSFAVSGEILYIGQEPWVKQHLGQVIVYKIDDLSEEQRTAISDCITGLVQQQGLPIEYHYSGNRLFTSQTAATAPLIQQKLDELRKQAEKQ